MSVFSSIGQAFKDGWNKNERVTNIQLAPGTYHHPDADNESPNYVESLHKLSKNTSRNALYSTSEELSTTSKIAKTSASDNKDTYVYENNFKLPINEINALSRHYRFIYDNAAEMVLDYGIPEKIPENKDGAPTGTDQSKSGNKSDVWIQAEVLSMPVVPSLFNPFYGINIVGITGNSPLLNEGEKDVQGSDKEIYTAKYNANIGDDISDCSIKKLVELSNQQKMGRANYKYADFMFCKNLGKYSNNRLITLRRFPLPIGDDIWSLTHYNSENGTGIGKENAFGVDIPVDTGRLVTWLDDTNKLEDILKYEYKDEFVERTGEYWDVNSQEDSEDRGIVGSLVNLANPTYRKWVGSGFAGGGNKILNAFAGATDNKLFSASSTNQNSNILTRYDHNKIYEPTATVRDTHLYSGKLTFSQTFSLTFDYELRAYENINPRTALLDLLNNIHQVTYKAGKFWGGANWFMGAPGNRDGWKTANALIDGTFDKLSDTFEMIMRGNLNFGDFLGNLVNKGGKAILSGLKNVAADAKNGKLGDKIADAAGKYQVGTMLKGMLKNKLGRPALYATNSVLKGDPVGLWHLTIGNPRNPIMAMGNLIIDGSTVQHYGPLGIDDFPTGLKVTINLKHGKSRDMIDIGKMYTMGKEGLAIPLGRTSMNKMYKNTVNIDALQFSTAFSSVTPSISNGISVKDE